MGEGKKGGVCPGPRRQAVGGLWALRTPRGGLGGRVAPSTRRRYRTGRLTTNPPPPFPTFSDFLAAFVRLHVSTVGWFPPGS